MEWRQKDLKGLEATISQYESSLRGAWVQPEGTLATTPIADDAPAVSAMPDPLTSPPGEEQTRSMEVDDGDDHQPPGRMSS